MMALSNAEKLVNLGMPTQLAQAVQDMIAAATTGLSYSDADAEAAIAAKTEVAALTPSSTAADIVAALQA
jgi:hypothetical protein